MSVAKNCSRTLGYDYSEVSLPNANRSRIVGAITGKGTLPQVFVNGKHVGGYEELQNWAKKSRLTRRPTAGEPIPSRRARPALA